MQFETSTSPHLPPQSSVAKVMRQVVFALLPGIAIYVWFFGFGVLQNIGVALAVCLVCEALMLALRRAPLKLFLGDWSAIITALLLALALPPNAEWWLPAIGAFFAMAFGKHLYGGLGYNPFNPAMIGYVVLLISFPLPMSQWPAPLSAQGCADALALLQGCELDAISAATPLDAVKTELSRGVGLLQSNFDALAPLFTSGWAWISLAWLAGGAWLLLTGTIRWHIPTAMLATIAALALVFNWQEPNLHTGALFQLLTGATLLGAFFIATDPVSASTTVKGRLIYGAGIGLLVWIIRTWGGYPDAVAFAVLLMNICAPLIDYYTRPRVYGH